MTWLAPGSHEYIIAALRADITQELSLAAEYLSLACRLQHSHDAGLRHTIAICVTTAYANATALAVEIMCLGESAPAPSPGKVPAIAGGVVQNTRAALAHYVQRAAMAKKYGLERLHEVFRGIIRTKQEHLRDLPRVASACGEFDSRKQ